jgi:RNA polymerase sigma-70 factor (ECF subfamily)
MGSSTQPWMRVSPEPTPEELALRAQRGSRAAFSELVERFEGRLFNFLLRRVGSAADAEDLAQDAFVRAWQRIGTYKSDWRFSTWLFTIALRLAVSKARRTPARPRLIRDDQAVSEPSAADGEAGRGRIWALVEETLTPEQQTAVWLRYVEDLAMKDIARVLGRSQVSVRVMLFRARALLAEQIRLEPAVAEEIIPMVRLSGTEAKRGVRC